MSLTDFQIDAPTDAYTQGQPPTSPASQALPQNGLTNNFQVCAQFSVDSPSYTFPLPEPYSQPEVTVEFDGQELLTGCENAGLLQDIQPQVSGLGAEIFGGLCQGITNVTGACKAEFLEQQNVAVPIAKLEIEAPKPTVWTPPAAYTA